jgi:hypothetical protein
MGECVSERVGAYIAMYKIAKYKYIMAANIKHNNYIHLRAHLELCLDINSICHASYHSSITIHALTKTLPVHGLAKRLCELYWCSKRKCDRVRNTLRKYIQ